jgi:hypothetical protein
MMPISAYGTVTAIWRNRLMVQSLQSGGTAMTDESEKEHETDKRALEIIRTSGLLNPNATMTQIMEATQRVLELPPTEARHSDTFIHSHFIYKHEE